MKQEVEICARIARRHNRRVAWRSVLLAVLFGGCDAAAVETFSAEDYEPAPWPPAQIGYSGRILVGEVRYYRQGEPTLVCETVCIADMCDVRNCVKEHEA